MNLTAGESENDVFPYLEQFTHDLQSTQSFSSQFRHRRWISADSTISTGGDASSTLDLLELLQRRRSSMSMLREPIPATMQLELALLWRTMDILRFSVGIPGAMQSFYKELTRTISTVRPLSLSKFSCAYENQSTATSSKSKTQQSLVSIEPETTTVGGCSNEDGLFLVPELAYLKPGSTFEKDEVNDPLGLVQKLSDAAERIAMTVPLAERGVFYSFYLAMAVKSGRLSLLLRGACLLSMEESPDHSMGSYDSNGFKDVDITLLKDIVEHVCHSATTTSNSKRQKDVVKTANAFTTTAPSQGEKPAIVLSFGKADHGKLGLGDTQLHRLIPTVVDRLQHVDVIKVSSMGTTTIAIDRDGLAYMWGSGGSAGGGNSISASGGSVAQGHGPHDHRVNIHPQLIPTLPLGSRVADISCGLGHALFLLRNGQVWSSGSGGNGRLGLGDTIDRKTPCLVTGLLGESISAVQCGASHSMALGLGGAVYCWGKNTQGQCGMGHVDELLRPIVNKTLQGERVVQLVAGWEHSIALTDNGSVYGWGSGYKDNRRGVVPPVLGLGDNEGRNVPERLKSLDFTNSADEKERTTRIVRLACGWDHCLALDNKGLVRSWGSGQNGKLGRGNEESVSAPSVIAALEGLKIISISAGCEHSAAITDTGLLYTWGHGDGGRLGHGDNNQCTLPVPVQAMTLMHIRPTDVHCGDKFTVVIGRPEEEIVTLSSSATVTAATTAAVDSVTRSTEIYTADGHDAAMDAMLSQLSLSPKLFERQRPSDDGHDGTDISLSMSRRQVCSALLSLLARAATHALDTRDNTDITLAANDDDGQPYAVECSPAMFDSLLSLIDAHYDAFCSAIDPKSGFSTAHKSSSSDNNDHDHDQNHNGIGMGTNVSTSLKLPLLMRNQSTPASSTVSIFGAPASSSPTILQSKSQAGLLAAAAGTASEEAKSRDVPYDRFEGSSSADKLASCGPLLSILTILEVNLSILSGQLVMVGRDDDHSSTPTTNGKLSLPQRVSMPAGTQNTATENAITTHSNSSTSHAAESTPSAGNSRAARDRASTNDAWEDNLRSQMLEQTITYNSHEIAQVLAQAHAQAHAGGGGGGAAAGSPSAGTSHIPALPVSSNRPVGPQVGSSSMSATGGRNSARGSSRGGGPGMPGAMAALSARRPSMSESRLDPGVTPGHDPGSVNRSHQDVGNDRPQGGNTDVSRLVGVPSTSTPAHPTFPSFRLDADESDGEGDRAFESTGADSRGLSDTHLLSPFTGYDGMADSFLLASTEGDAEEAQQEGSVDDDQNGRVAGAPRSTRRKRKSFNNDIDSMLETSDQNRAGVHSPGQMSLSDDVSETGRGNIDNEDNEENSAFEDSHADDSNAGYEEYAEDDADEEDDYRTTDDEEEEEEGDEYGRGYVDEDTMDLQRAILSSMEQSSNSSLASSDYFQREHVGRGSKSMSGMLGLLVRTKEAMSSLAFQCFQPLFAAHNTTSNVSASNVDQSLMAHGAAYSVWQKIQTIAGSGFEALYSVAERQALLLQIIRTPMSLLHLLPGLSEGLHQVAERSHTDVFGGFLSNSCGAGTDRSTMMNDLITFVEFIKVSYLADNVDILAVMRDISVTQTYADGFRRSISCALFRIFRSLIIPTLELLIHTSIAPTQPLHQPWGHHGDKLFTLVVECVQIDLQAIFNPSSLSGINVSISELTTAFEQTFTAFILPVIANICAQSDSIPALAVLLPHAMKLLEIFRHHHSHASVTLQTIRSDQNNASQRSVLQYFISLQSWLDEQMKWILLFIAVALQALVNPPTKLGPPRLSSALLSCMHLLNVHKIEADAIEDAFVCFTNTDVRVPHLADSLVWVLLGHKGEEGINMVCASPHKPIAVSSYSTESGHLFHAANGTPTSLLLELDKFAQSSLAGSAWASALCDQGLWSDAGILSVTESSSPLSMILQACAFVKQEKDGKAVVIPSLHSDVAIGVTQPKTNVDWLFKIRLAVYALMLRLASVDASASTLNNEATQLELEAKQQLAWIGALVIVAVVTDAVEGSSRRFQPSLSVGKTGLMAAKRKGMKKLALKMDPKRRKSLLPDIFDSLKNFLAMPLGAAADVFLLPASDLHNDSPGTMASFKACLKRVVSSVKRRLVVCSQGIDFTVEAADLVLGGQFTVAGRAGSASVLADVATVLLSGVKARQLSCCGVWELACLRNRAVAAEMFAQTLSFVVTSPNPAPLRVFCGALRMGINHRQSRSRDGSGRNSNNSTVLTIIGQEQQQHQHQYHAAPIASTRLSASLTALEIKAVECLGTCTARGSDLNVLSTLLWSFIELLTTADSSFLLPQSDLLGQYHAAAHEQSTSSLHASALSSATAALKLHGISLNLLRCLRTHCQGRATSPTTTPPVATLASQRQLSRTLLSDTCQVMGNKVAALFTRHLALLRACERRRGFFLCPLIKDILTTSPRIETSVAAPKGEFTLGFWLKIPSSYHVKEADGGRRLHLISRIPEVGDFNYISLLGGGAAVSPTRKSTASSGSVCHCSPTVYLSEENPGELSMQVVVTVYQSMVTPTSANGKVDKPTEPGPSIKHPQRIELSYSSGGAVGIPRDRWVHCAVHVKEEVSSSGTAATTTGGGGNIAGGGPAPAPAAGAGAIGGKKQPMNETTYASLHVDGELVHSGSVDGGRPSVYQTVVMGTIPTNLGLISSIGAGPTNSIRINDASSVEQVDATDGPQLADVYWLSKPSVDAPVSPSLLPFVSTGLPPSAGQDLLTASLAASLSVLSTSIDALTDSSTVFVEGDAVRLLENVCHLSLKMLVTGDLKTQELVFQRLRSLVGGIKSTGSIAVAAAPTVTELLNCLIALVCVLTGTPSQSLSHSPVDASTPTDDELGVVTLDAVVEVWIQRAAVELLSLESKLRAEDWADLTTIEGNAFITGAASVLADAIRMELIDGSFFTSHALPRPDGDHMIWGVKWSQFFGARQLTGLLCAGAWPPIATLNRKVDVLPGTIFNDKYPTAEEGLGDLRGASEASPASLLSLALFPASAVTHTARGWSGFWVRECAGLSLRRADDSSTCAHTTLRLPTLLHPGSLFPVSELAVAQDCGTSVCLNDVLCDNDENTAAEGEKQSLFDFPSIDGLIALLQKTAMGPLHATGGPRVASVSGEEDLGPGSMQLARIMLQLRCLLVQVATMSELEGQEKKVQKKQLARIVRDALPALLSLAAADPLHTVFTAHESVGFRDASFNGVLGSILQDGDVNFIERLFLRLWKQVRILDYPPAVVTSLGDGLQLQSSTASRTGNDDVSSSSTADGSTSSLIAGLGSTKSGGTSIDWFHGVRGEASCPLIVLGGDVQVSDGTKVRANLHFSSVAASPLTAVSMDSMKGRWFYECTLLSDGLMQIGWANGQFRCEPVNGIGVGDHLHSWAYDGYRSSRWTNKSPEPYGRRWRSGDVVGALLDLDLLEMRFYLNGEDLGTAFLNFTGPEVFPALSLNVRQSVRINFGQFRFMYPPDDLDGKPYHAVWHAANFPKVPEILAAKSKERSTNTAAGSGVGASLSLGGAGEPKSNVGDGTSSPGRLTGRRQSEMDGERVVDSAEMAAAAAAATAEADRIRRSLIARAEQEAEKDESKALAASELDAENTGIEALLAGISRRAAAGVEGDDSNDDDDDDDNNGDDLDDKEEEDDEAERLIMDAGWRSRENAQRRLEREFRNHGTTSASDAAEESDSEQGDDTDADNISDAEMRRRLHLHGRRHDEIMRAVMQEEDEEEAQLLELQRQSLIESLIGMGFPVDWALRAVEHCDMPTSQDHAMSWILERMTEIDQQGKIEEGGDSSRVIEQEEIEEAASLENLRLQQQRQAAALSMTISSVTAGANSAAGGNVAAGAGPYGVNAGGGGTGSSAMDAMAQALGLGMGLGLGLPNMAGAAATTTPNATTTNASSNNNVSSGSDLRVNGLSIGTALGASPSGRETYNTPGTLPAPSATTPAAGGVRGTAGATDSLSGMAGDTTAAIGWNATELAYPPIVSAGHRLISLQTASQTRPDDRKQEVLAQMSHLRPSEMLPILASCEVSLCIFYARALLLRVVRSGMSIDSGSRHESLESSVTHGILMTAHLSSQQRKAAEEKEEERKRVLPLGSAHVVDEKEAHADMIEEKYTRSQLRDDKMQLIINFFQRSFHTSVSSGLQSGRLFPYALINAAGTSSSSGASGQWSQTQHTAGNAAKEPLRWPYLHENIHKSPAACVYFLSAAAVTLSDMLPALESQLFPHSQGAMVLEASSMQSLGSVSSLLCDLYLTSATGSDEDDDGDSLLNDPFVDINPKDGPLHASVARRLSRSILEELVEECVRVFEAAGYSAFDVDTSNDGIGRDWLHVGLAMTQGQWSASVLGHMQKVGASLESEGLPKRQHPSGVMWAYFTLRKLLTMPSVLGMQYHDDVTDDPLDGIVSAETLSRLLRASLAPNLSLRFCVYDLVALLLARVNVTLQREMCSETMGLALGGTDYQFSYCGSRRGVSDLWERYHRDAKDKVAGVASGLLPTAPAVDASLIEERDSRALQQAADYYVSVTKERKLLEIFGNCARIESSDVDGWGGSGGSGGGGKGSSAAGFMLRPFSRYSRAVAGVLLQWQQLRRGLGLAAFSHVHRAIVEDWVLKPSEWISDTLAAGAAGSSAAAGGGNVDGHGGGSIDRGDKGVDRDQREVIIGSEVPPAVPAGSRRSSLSHSPTVTLLVSQLSSSSVTVCWTNVPPQGPSVDPIEMDAMSAAGGGSSVGSASAATLIAPAPVGLYIAVASNAGGLENYSLLVPNLPPAGSYRIDGLFPDTLYKVTIASTFLMGEYEEESEADGEEDEMEIDDTSHTQMAVHFAASDGDSEVTNGQASRLGFDEESSMGSAAVTSIATRIAKSSVSSHSRPQTTTTMNIPPIPEILAVSMSLYASTEAETPFVISPSTSSPNLVLGGCGDRAALMGAHRAPQTLRNAISKKWSTARTDLKMVTGLHRWDVHIDRCVSKNIFIGVATADARLDNYVGCDKYGWAFLANKAIWHGKSKLKSYGELFRTGDTVTVALDLDRGTLSFSLNGKDLGEAATGLNDHVPLFAAFSLYNEDDQLSILPSRIASGTSSAPGAGATGGAASSSSMMLSAIPAVSSSPTTLAAATAAAAAPAYNDDGTAGLLQLASPAIHTSGPQSMVGGTAGSSLAVTPNPKSTTVSVVTKPGLSSPFSHSASAAERLVDRLETLQSMLQFVMRGYQYGLHVRTVADMKNSDATSDGASSANAIAPTVTPPSLQSSTADELSRRWRLRSRGVNLRSVLVDGDFVTIVGSPSACLSLSGNKLSPGDVVLLSDGSAEQRYCVLGAARHRVWLQLLGSSGWVSSANPPVVTVPSSVASPIAAHGSPAAASAATTTASATTTTGESDNALPSDATHSSSTTNQQGPKEFIGMTKDTLEQAFSSSTIKLLLSRSSLTDDAYQALGLGGNNGSSHRASSMLFPLTITTTTATMTSTVTDHSASSTSSGTSSSPSLESADGLSRLLSNGSAMWTAKHDEALLQWLETLAYHGHSHPLLLDPGILPSTRDTLQSMAALMYVNPMGSPNPSRSSSDSPEKTRELQPSPAVPDTNNNDYVNDPMIDIADIAAMFVAHTDEDIQARALLLLHLNDVLEPLLPILAPVDGLGEDVNVGGENHPAQMLLHCRHLVFLNVTSEFTRLISTPRSPLSQPTVLSSSSSSVNTSIGLTTSSNVSAAVTTTDAIMQLLQTGLGPAGAVTPPSTTTTALSPPMAVSAKLPAPSVSAVAAASSVLPHTPSPSLPSVAQRATTSSAQYIPLAVLEVEEDLHVVERMLGMLGRRGSGSGRGHADNGNVHRSDNTVRMNARDVDIRWRLSAGIQASLVGQMFRHFDQLSEKPSLTTKGVGAGAEATNNNANTQPQSTANVSSASDTSLKSPDGNGSGGAWGGSDTSLMHDWEDSLRRVCVRGSSLRGNLEESPGVRAVPFLVRLKKMNVSGMKSIVADGGNQSGVVYTIDPLSMTTAITLPVPSYSRIGSSTTHAALASSSSTRLFRLLDLAYANISHQSSKMKSSRSAGCNGSHRNDVTDEDRPDVTFTDQDLCVEFPRGSSSISEWSLFSAFVVQALEQIERVMDTLFVDDDRDHNSNNDVAQGDEDEDVLGMLLIHPEHGAGCASLLLQLAHCTGVLLGLAFRYGVSCRCQLPRTFRHVLCMIGGGAGGGAENINNSARNHKYKQGSNLTIKTKAMAKQFTIVAAWALRHGLTAVYPEAAWNLLRPSFVTAMLTGGITCFCPETLRREALYDSGVYPEDPHVQLFWIALAELTPIRVLQLLRKLWTHTSLPGEAYFVPCPNQHGGEVGSNSSYASRSALPSPLRILQPTAVAMLSPDSADITIFTEKSAISIPRFSSIAIMMFKLNALLL